MASPAPNAASTRRAGWHELLVVRDIEGRRIALLRDARGDLGVAVGDGEVVRRPGLRQEEAVRTLRVVAGLCEQPSERLQLLSQSLLRLRKRIEAVTRFLRTPARIDEVLGSRGGDIHAAAVQAKASLPNIEDVHEAFARLSAGLQKASHDLGWIAAALSDLHTLSLATTRLVDGMATTRDLPALPLAGFLRAASAHGGAAVEARLAAMPAGVGDGFLSEGEASYLPFRRALSDVIAAMPQDAWVPHHGTSVRKFAEDLGLDG